MTKKLSKKDMNKLLESTRRLVKIFHARDILWKRIHHLETQLALLHKIDSRQSAKMQTSWQQLTLLRVSLGRDGFPHARAVKRWLRKHER